MIEYGEFYNEDTIKDCTIDELRAIIKGLVSRLDQDQMFYNESLIDKRWYREALKEERHKGQWKEKYFKDQIKSLEIQLAVAKRMAKTKKETVN
jgi:radical SAM superfamily enzyme YgiQ (UPF0313 family)